MSSDITSVDADRTTPEPATSLGACIARNAIGFLRQAQVLALVPVSKSTLWRRVQAHSFPSPIKLSERVTVWRADDVQRWIEQQGTPAARPDQVNPQCHGLAVKQGAAISEVAPLEHRVASVAGRRAGSGASQPQRRSPAGRDRASRRPA